jgi:hypothetical protein
MMITKAFEAWEQETENKARQTREVEIALEYASQEHVSRDDRRSHWTDDRTNRGTSDPG